MKTLPLSEVKAKLSGLVDTVRKTDEEIMITKNGKPAALLISAEEYESWKETQSIRSDPEFMKEIRSGLKALKKAKSKIYSLEELLPE